MGRSIVQERSENPVPANDLLLLTGGSPHVDALPLLLILFGEGIENFIEIFCLSRPWHISKQNVIGADVLTVKPSHRKVRTGL